MCKTQEHFLHKPIHWMPVVFQIPTLSHPLEFQDSSIIWAHNPFILLNSLMPWVSVLGQAATM
jgi:hypothetical protein